MTAFVRPSKAPPIELFASMIRFSRPSLEAAYYSAFEAARARNAEMDRFMLDPLRGVELTHEEAERSHIEAYRQDIRADQQSMIVLFVLDDSLQRLGRTLLGKAPGIARGFGRLYNGVPLTTLLRATTNCVRHVSEWDDNENLKYPYDVLDETDRDIKMAIGNIRVLQEALGVGRHENIWAAPCFHVLAILDGKFGTEAANYDRLESAVMLAAREIVEAADSSLLPHFETAVLKQGR
jgi:hypothetical protein